jgi:hypothetical protein
MNHFGIVGLVSIIMYGVYEWGIQKEHFSSDVIWAIVKSKVIVKSNCKNKNL